MAQQEGIRQYGFRRHQSDETLARDVDDRAQRYNNTTMTLSYSAPAIYIDAHGAVRVRIVYYLGCLVSLLAATETHSKYKGKPQEEWTYS